MNWFLSASVALRSCKMSLSLPLKEMSILILFSILDYLLKKVFVSFLLSIVSKL